MKKSKRILIATFAVLAVILVVGYVLFGWMFYRYQSTDCKERGKAYGIRVERLKRDARTTLRIGTHQEDVIRFFKKTGCPFRLTRALASTRERFIRRDVDPLAAAPTRSSRSAR